MVIPKLPFQYTVDQLITLCDSCTRRQILDTGLPLLYKSSLYDRAKAIVRFLF